MNAARLRNRSAGPRSASGLPGLALALLLMLLIADPSAAAPMPMPPLAGIERGAYRTRDLRSGEELGQAEWTLRQETQDGRPVLQLQEHGQDTGRQQERTVWSDRMSLDLWGARPTLTSTRESRDPAGRPLKLEQREFNYDLGSGELITTDARTGGKKSRSIRLTGRTVTPELLPALLRLLPERADRAMELDLVTREGQKVGLRAKLVGRERVAVPAGSFECFKVELEPTGLAGVLAAFKPLTLFMWLTVDSPHYWVRYEGPGGADSRVVVRELLRFETKTAVGASLVTPRAEPPATAVGSVTPSTGARGAQNLGYLALLAAIVFQVGVEGTLLLSAPPAAKKPHPSPLLLDTRSFPQT